jgi:small subunit ribosomal protein S8
MVTNLTTKAVAKKFSSNISDPVADLLTRIRNSNLAYKDELFAPASKLNDAVLKILVTEGFIASYGREGEGVHQSFRIYLKYGAKRQRAITGLKRISKPGRRIYRGRGELPRVLGGLGIAIVSTSQGVMTDREASRKRIGGEILAYVW